MASVEINRRLFLTADRERVVEAGDPDAAFLYATPGKRIPADEAERYGLLGDPPERAPEVEAEAASADLTAEEEVDRLQAEPEPVPEVEAEPEPPKVAKPASKRSRRRT